MFQAVSRVWALLLGVGLIMLGNGLQGSLLGLRASMEGFHTSVIGLVMSGYFLGLLAGSMFVPRVVSRVGHVRSFGALASLASTSILAHAVFIEPWTWWAMRLITGFSYAGLYIVTESWLNQASTNENRGQLLGVYMLISLGGVAGGQFMLNLSPPQGFELFVLTSILISLAVIPILVSVTPAPAMDTPESAGVRLLYKVSPLGVVGMFLTGSSMGAIFGMGAVYATDVGLSVADVSVFMASIFVGGAIVQYPLGKLSDIVGRRPVIIASSMGGAIIAMMASLYTGSGWVLFGIITLLGGFIMPLYSLCIAHTNDYLNPQQMVAASSTLILVSSMGAVVGPPITAFAMDFADSRAFFWSLAFSLGVISLFAIWRMFQRYELPEEEKGEFVALAPAVITPGFSPDVDMEQIEAATAEQAEPMEALFEELVSDLHGDDEQENPG